MATDRRAFLKPILLGAVWLALLAAAAIGSRTLADSSLFPLREVGVFGTLTHTRPEDIERAALTHIRGGFFTVDLGAVRAALESLPWIRRAAVRRTWPDRIEVTIEEHIALARWGGQSDGVLISRNGERFQAQFKGDLPYFDGPPGSEVLIAERYAVLVKVLVPLGGTVRSIVLSPRHAWQLRFDDGLRIALGRDASGDVLEQRLARFVSTYRQRAASGAERLEYVDLRYPNGYALRFANIPGAGRAGARVKG